MPSIDTITMSSTGQPSAVKASLPIELLPTGLAPIFTHTHPIVLLSAFYLRFPALVADPTATLLNSLAPLAVVQMSYAVICLPATGTSPRPAKKSKPGAKKTNDASSARPLVSFLPAVYLIALLMVLFLYRLRSSPSSSLSSPSPSSQLSKSSSERLSQPTSPKQC
jgi:phosphatidylinositol glycan class F